MPFWVDPSMLTFLLLSATAYGGSSVHLGHLRTPHKHPDPLDDWNEEQCVTTSVTDKSTLPLKLKTFKSLEELGGGKPGTQIAAPIL